MDLIEFILKSRSGYYKDNPKNRKLGRVGQPYGKSSSGDETFEEKEKKYRNKGFTYSTTSLEEYKGDKNREKLHRKIVNDYVSRSSKYGKKPVSVFTLGGSGAGKSTVLNKLKQENGLYNNIVVVDSDDIKTKSFKNDFEIYNRQSDGSAAKRLHDESSIVADEIVKGIQSVQNDYLKDGTMKSLNKAVKEIMDARSKGYEVNLVGVTISVEEALRRAELRAERTGRRIPEDIIIEAHTGSTKTFLKLIEMGIVDSMKLYDNSGKEPVLIYDSGEKASNCE